MIHYFVTLNLVDAIVLLVCILNFFFFSEIDLSFPHREVQIQRGIDPKDLFTLEEEIGR